MSGCQGCSFKGMSTAVEKNFVGVRFREETNLTLCATGDRILVKGSRAARMELVIEALEKGSH